MPSFSLTPLDPFPPTAGPFPSGTQFQDETVNVGPPEPKYVNFTGPGVQATYDNNAGRVNVFVSQTGGTQFQDEGVNRGGPAPSFVNFTGDGVTATYTPSSDTVVVNIPGGGGGGGGTPVMFAMHAANQTTGELLIYESATMYNPSIGQYNVSTGVFTALADGFFSFNASAVITRTPAPPSNQTWYLGIGKYDHNDFTSVIYSLSQFNDLFTGESSQGLGSSVSVNLYLFSGEHVVVSVLQRSFGGPAFDRISLSSNFFFSAGSLSPFEGAIFMPSFSVIYYPLNLF
jgi:hypothetical protein